MQVKDVTVKRTLEATRQGCFIKICIQCKACIVYIKNLNAVLRSFISPSSRTLINAFMDQEMCSFRLAMLRLYKKLINKTSNCHKKNASMNGRQKLPKRNNKALCWNLCCALTTAMPHKTILLFDQFNHLTCLRVVYLPITHYCFIILFLFFQRKEGNLFCSGDDSRDAQPHFPR